MRAYLNWQSHLDEVFVKINGERHHLWRVVDHDGEGLKLRVGPKSHLHLLGFEPVFCLNKINNLEGREGSMGVAFPPPLSLEKLFSRSGCGWIFPLF